MADILDFQIVEPNINTNLFLSFQAQKNGFDGPTLGARVSSENKRDFDDSVLKAGQSVIGLQYGSNKGASQVPTGFPSLNLALMHPLCKIQTVVRERCVHARYMQNVFII